MGDEKYISDKLQPDGPSETAVIRAGENVLHDVNGSSDADDAWLLNQAVMH